MKITKAETIRRLKALPLDKPYTMDECCPIEGLYRGVIVRGDYHQYDDVRRDNPRWLTACIVKLDRPGGPEWADITPRECLEALGVRP